MDSVTKTFMALYRRQTDRGASTAVENTEQGFTMIELLMVIIIVSILAVITLPSLLSQAAKAKQAAAISDMSAINRAQQVFYQEHGLFSTTISELGIGQLNEDSRTYSYTIQTVNTGTKSTQALANPIDSALRGYVGLVFSTSDESGNVMLTSVICEGNRNATPAPSLSTVNNIVQATGCNKI